MRAQLEVWLEVMLNGSGQAPRQRSRDPQTARIHIMGIAPIIGAWADAGHQSLAEITPEQVRAALPKSGPQRNWAEYGLRSLFKVLKARKLTFTNPTRGMPATAVNATVPLPLDSEAIRRALDSPDPAVAFAVALVAFHALTAKQLAQLHLTDIVDGRLALEGRDIPLAGPVRVRLAAWLDHRNRTWPASINPHLFVGRVARPASPSSANSSHGREPTCVPKPCEKTASCRRSTPPAATSAASATSSASASKPPCATRSPWSTPTSNTDPKTTCLLRWTGSRLGR